MHQVRSLLSAALFVGTGYLLAMTQGVGSTLVAQSEEKDPAGEKIHEVFRRLNDSRETLESAGRYSAVTDGVNSFLVLSGGGNAREDLESGRGVDPETFAALYAGRALPEIQSLVSANEHGQVTYNNEVVRMYSKARLQKAFSDRLKYIEFSN